MNEYKLSQLLGELREKSPNDTDGQKMLRDLIDFQYKATQQIFHFEFYLYVVLFLMPMVFQQYSEDPMYIIGFNYWCLLIQLAIGAGEMIQLRRHGWDYFTDIFNITELAGMILQVVYCILRIQSPTKAIPDTEA